MRGVEVKKRIIQKKKIIHCKCPKIICFLSVTSRISQTHLASTPLSTTIKVFKIKID